MSVQAGYRNRWVKIAEFVTEYSHCNTERTDVQCRARIDSLHSLWQELGVICP